MDFLRLLTEQSLVSFAGGIIVGVLGMLFGKILPWRTENRRVNYNIAADKLRYLEKALDGDFRRVALLLGGFVDEPEAPDDDPRQSDGIRSLFGYQRERSRIAKQLPGLLADVKDTREQLLGLRQRLLGDPKTPLDQAILRIEGRVTENETRLNQIIDELANQPRIHISPDQPDTSDMRGGDFWVQTPSSE